MKKFFVKYKGEIGLFGLIVYVIILGIGTVAEVFEIQTILDWWIFRPPGK